MSVSPISLDHGAKGAKRKPLQEVSVPYNTNSGGKSAAHIAHIGNFLNGSEKIPTGLG